MVALPAVIHSQVLPLVFGRSAGLRLLAGSVFKAFLAVTVRPHSASSSVFHSIRRLAGVVFHPAANPAVKRTGLRPSAYFCSLVPSYSALCRPTFIPALRLYPRFLLWVFGALPGFACVRLVGFRPFGPLALV